MERTSNKIITDMNFDCLEKIFKCLDQNDLINVAESNKHLRSAAKLSFKSKFGKKQMILFGNEFYRHRIERRRSYQMLRCFGHLIKNLKIFASDESLYLKHSSKQRIILELSKSMFHLITYIKKYCKKTVTEIKTIGNYDIRKRVHLVIRNGQIYFV